MLGFNEIAVDGACAVIDALKNKGRFRKVDFNGNQFGSRGKLEIQEQMEIICKEDALEPMRYGAFPDNFQAGVSGSICGGALGFCAVVVQKS